MTNPARFAHPVDELEPEDEPVIADAILDRLVAERFGRLLFWLADAKTMIQMGQRGYAILHSVLPASIDGMTLDEIGKQSGVTRQAIDKYITDLRDTFGIRGHLMRSDHTRANCQNAQLNR